MYEYRCQECNARFEQLRRMSDADKDLICPKCASQRIERLLSAFAAHGCGGGGRFT